MFTPSNMPSHKPAQQEPPASKPSPKKAYVRPEHLTHRPFRTNPELAKLQQSKVTRKNQTNFKIRRK